MVFSATLPQHTETNPAGFGSRCTRISDIRTCKQTRGGLVEAYACGGSLQTDPAREQRAGGSPAKALAPAGDQGTRADFPPNELARDAWGRPCFNSPSYRGWVYLVGKQSPGIEHRLPGRHAQHGKHEGSVGDPRVVSAGRHREPGVWGLRTKARLLGREFTAVMRKDLQPTR